MRIPLVFLFASTLFLIFLLLSTAIHAFENAGGDDDDGNEAGDIMTAAEPKASTAKVFNLVAEVNNKLHNSAKVAVTKSAAAAVAAATSAPQLHAMKQTPARVSPVFEFFDSLNRAQAMSRDAVSLAVNCDQGFDPCSPHGICSASRCVCASEPKSGYWSGDDCKECDIGWAGQDCKIECKGGSCNRCSNHGICSEGVAGDGSCACQQDQFGFWGGVDCAICKSGYFGENCDKSCPGADRGAQPCFGRGECLANAAGVGFCVCDEGWGSATGCEECDAMSYGPNCLSKCDGYIRVNTSAGLGWKMVGAPCSGHGRCYNGTKANGTCICEPSYGGHDCSLKCPSSCSGHGTCNDGAAGDAMCTCDQDFSPPDCSECVANRTGIGCDVLCPLHPTTQIPCTRNGKCVLINSLATCECGSGYDDMYCDAACGGSPPCSGHGRCHVSNMSCSCYQNDIDGYWAGPRCDRCDVRYNNSYNCNRLCPSTGSGVCNGHGQCFDGACICERASALNPFEYCGTACDIVGTPNEVDQNLNLIKCSAVYCADKFQSGGTCSLQCPGTNEYSQYACNGNGLCSEGRANDGRCHCFSGFSGLGCEFECPKSSGQQCGSWARGVCTYSSRGTFPMSVTLAPHCDCREGFAGRACELMCPRTGNAICAGHGVCNGTYRGDGNCACEVGWTGKACDVPCMCNLWNGVCDLKECGNYKPMDRCFTCKCFGNFTGLCNECIPGTQGHRCEGQCIHGNTTGKICKCEEHWSGADCDTPCPRDTTTNKVCGGEGKCDWGNNKPGICQCNTSWFGPACTAQCMVSNCTQNQSLVHAQCNKLTGACECLDDATGHWAGSRCSVCVEGWFGQQCNQLCQCSDHGHCDKDTGECQCYQSPERGFYSGQQCDTCSPGYIGQNCERLSVKYTRQKIDTVGGPTLRPSPTIYGGIPATDVIYMDERLEKLYAGGFPLVLFDANMSTPGVVRKINQSSTNFFNATFKAPDGNETVRECYDEVAHVFVHENGVYFLMHPQMQCNISVRLLRQDRRTADLNLTAAEKVWEMPYPSYWSRCVGGCNVWGNRTTRIVSAFSLTKQILAGEVGSGDSTKPPLLVFLLGQPKATQGGAFEPSNIVVRVEINLVTAPNPLSVASGAWGLYLDETYEMEHITIRHKTEYDPSDVIMVTGKLQSTSAFDTWEVLLFKFDITGLFPANPALASLRSSVDCWPAAGDPNGPQSKKCDRCSGVPRAYFGATSDRSILLAVSHPDTVFVAWVRYFDFIRDDPTISFHALIRDKCEAAKYNSRQFSVSGRVTGIETTQLPDMVVSVASASAPGSSIVSFAYDPTVAQLHLSVTVFPTSSRLIKFTLANKRLSILGTLSLGFVSTQTVAGTRATAEVFTHMTVDSHARALYCINAGVTPIKLAAFLLYDALSVTPNIADQRGDTRIIVNGTGFRRIMLPLPPPIETPRYVPRCLFSNGDQVDALEVSESGIVCVTTTISEKDVAGSCGVQVVEVSMFGGTWFTENGVELRRVRAAKIDGPVTPERGPTRGHIYDYEFITFSGTGFVDSKYSVCKFSSNSTDPSIPKEALYSKLLYISPNEAKCKQPPATLPSPDYSFLDVSLDGQLFMETRPPFYTIVGAPTNISAPLVVTVKAETRTQVTIPVRIVDRLNHWVGNRGDIDSVSRPICIPKNVTVTERCDSLQFPWRERGDGYPWPVCRDIYYELSQGMHCRWTNPLAGGITFSDIQIVEPRIGNFLLRSIESELDRQWRIEVLIRIVPGDGVALALSNRRAILERPSFVPKVPLSPAPEVIVLDRLGNKVDNPPASLEVTATPYYVYDNNQSIKYSQASSRKKAPDSETIRFPAIFLDFIHGVTHYVNFTSVPVLRSVTSPPLRTALCENPDRSYKVPLEPDGPCKPCPPEGAKCNGSEIIVVLPGYWRGESPTDIYKCKASSDICTANGCATGYYGPLCSLCEKGWGKVGSTKCSQCPDVGTSIAIIVVSAFFLIIGLTGWTINILRQAEVTDLAIILRTVVNHMQAAGKLGEFSTAWDPFLKDVFDVQNSASGLSFSGLSSLSCIISDMGADYEAIFTAYMSLPSLTVVMTGLVLFTVRMLKLKPVLTAKLLNDVVEEVKNMPSARIGVLLHRYPWYTVATTTVSIFMFTLYQTLITQATAVLNCREFVIAPGKKQQFLAVDMSINCTDSGDHKFKTAAYIAAVAYGVGIPSAFVFGYKTVGKTLGNMDLTNMMFQFLVGGYKKELWYWQAIIMVRKLVLVLVITFIGENPQLQSYGGMWTMSIALVLQIWFEPNERDLFNRVETLSLAVITLTLNLGLLYFWDAMPVFGRNVLTAFLIMVTIGVIIMFMYYMYDPIKDTISTKISLYKKSISEYMNRDKAVVEERGLHMWYEDMDYEPPREEAQTALNEFEGAGRAKHTDLVADFGELDFNLGLTPAPAMMPVKAGGGGGGRGAASRAGGVRRTMPLVSESELRHLEVADL